MSDEPRDLFSEKTVDGGVVRLAHWPEGYVLWLNGEIVWKQWESIPEFAIAKLQVKPGDVVILKTLQRISDTVAGRLRDMFKALLPHDNKVVVLEQLDIAVLTKDDTV